MTYQRAVQRPPYLRMTDLPVIEPGVIDML
jgi:hypothetical protein